MVPGIKLGSYEVLLGIARGGMAQIWAARQHGARGFNRLVALKTVLPELADPELEAMFLEEARLAARVHHPNVCDIFELVEDGGVLALAMEWIDGDTLNAVLEASPARLEPRVAAQIVAHTASGLHAAHELRDESGVPLSLVHRDVSPHNVLISRDGHVKVTDFGVAKAMGSALEQTEAGRVKGKLSYMSPEQAQGAPLDRRSDIFSLGVVLYVATVGAHPFRKRGQDRARQLLNLLAHEVTPPSEAVPLYPKALESIVLKAMRHDPQDRFSTADEMRGELCAWILQTGGLVTEREISRVVLERIGPSIERRGARIAASLRASDDRRGESSVVLALAPRMGERDDVEGVDPGNLSPPAKTVETSFVTTLGGELRGRRLPLRRAWLAVAGCGVVGVLGLYRAAQRDAPHAAATEPAGVAAAELAPAGIATTTEPSVCPNPVDVGSAGPSTAAGTPGPSQTGPSQTAQARTLRSTRPRGSAAAPGAAAPRPSSHRTTPARNAASLRIGPRETEL